MLDPENKEDSHFAKMTIPPELGLDPSYLTHLEKKILTKLTEICQDSDTFQSKKVLEIVRKPLPTQISSFSVNKTSRIQELLDRPQATKTLELDDSSSDEESS